MGTSSFYTYAQQPRMDKMWKGQAKNRTINTERGKIFRDGRYAMFIHWGLFSQLVNKWRERLSSAISSYLSSNYHTMSSRVDLSSSSTTSMVCWLAGRCTSVKPTILNTKIELGGTLIEYRPSINFFKPYR